MIPHSCSDLLAFCYLAEAVAWSRAPETIRDAMDLLGLPADTPQHYIEFTGSGSPAALVLPAAGHRYVIIAGTTTAFQWAIQIAAHQLTPWPSTGWQVNELYLVWLGQMQGALVSNTPTTFIGHSLGGAMAQLLMAESRRQAFDATAVAIGAPRVGDAAFGAAHSEFIEQLWVVGDPIPLIPPRALGYRHSGTIRLATKGGELQPAASSPAWTPTPALHFTSEYVSRLSRCPSAQDVEPSPTLIGLDVKVQGAANMTDDC